MRRIWKVIALALVLALVGAACSGGGEDSPGEVEQLCELEPPRDVDFTILNEIVDIVINGPVLGGRQYTPAVMYDPENVDLEDLYLGAFDAVYRFEGLTSNDLPDEIRAEITRLADAGTIDFSILDQHVKDLAQNDPRFEQLGRERQQTQVFAAAAQGVLVALGDPFAKYFSPEETFAHDQSSTGEFVGFGFQWQRNDRNEVEIQVVHEGTPADQGGLRAYDVVLFVDGKSVEYCGRQAFSDAIRGGDGETAVFTVRRPDGTIEDVEMTRGAVTLQAVSSLPGVERADGSGNTADDIPFKAPMRDRNGDPVEGILYLDYRNYRDNATSAAAFVLQNTSYPKGIILDLRGNPGGSVQAAKRFTDFFMRDDALYYTHEDALGRQQREMIGDRFDLAPDTPLIILLGPDPYDRPGSTDNSWSSSEAMAAALQAHGRATIVGQRSGGKGMTNFNVPLSDGGELKIGIWLFISPDGRYIQGEDLDGDGNFETGGVIPDVEVIWTNDDYRQKNRNSNWDPELFTAIDILLGR